MGHWHVPLPGVSQAPSGALIVLVDGRRFYPRCMATTDWRPLSWRQGDGPAVTTWREAVPAALERPLRAWVNETLEGNPLTGTARGISERVLLRLNLVGVDYDDQSGLSRAATTRQFLAYHTIPGWLPDIVDAVLDLLPVPSAAPAKSSSIGKSSSTGSLIVEKILTRPDDLWLHLQRRELAALLDDSLSVLRIREDGRGLERRADAQSEAAFGAAVKVAESASAAGSAASHLRTAWGCVYALRPDPVKAYAEAIKSVESVAHAVVEPNNAKATLGTMLGHLRSCPDLFSLAIPGPDGKGAVGPLIACMTLLWEGQTSRHGSSAPTRVETLGEATMALHLAVTLVQWFAAGAVCRV